MCLSAKTQRSLTSIRACSKCSRTSFRNRAFACPSRLSALPLSGQFRGRDPSPSGSCPMGWGSDRLGPFSTSHGDITSHNNVVTQEKYFLVFTTLDLNLTHQHHIGTATL